MSNFGVFSLDYSPASVYFRRMNVDADDESGQGMLVEMASLCATHGIAVVSGCLAQYPSTSAVIQCESTAFNKANVEKAIQLCKPSYAVLDASISITGVLVSSAWLVGESMVFYWNDAEDDDGASDPDDGEDPGPEQLADLARRLADDPTFRRASNAAEREHVAHQWLPGVGFTPTPSELREIARMAQVVWEFEIMPGEVAALVSGGATPADIAAQLGIGMTKAKRMVAQAKIG